SREYPRLPLKTLSLLPDATLPALDQVFAEHLPHNFAIAGVIARYATGAIADRVKASWPSGCQPALIAYFLRVQPEFGMQQLRAELSQRPCSRILSQTAEHYVSPDWEKVAVGALADPAVAVKIDAVQALGSFGSPTAVTALLGAFRYWHE